MAERRMFAKSVVQADKFLNLPQAARCLYFALGMEADDDGMVGAPKKIMRANKIRSTALDALCQAGYVHLFDTGVLAIHHWTTNNQIRKDRYIPTVYENEKISLVFLTAGGQPSIGKNSIEKNSIG